MEFFPESVDFNLQILRELTYYLVKLKIFHFFTLGVVNRKTFPYNFDLMKCIVEIKKQS